MLWCLVSHGCTVVVVCAVTVSQTGSYHVPPKGECVPRTRVISDLPDYPEVDHQDLCLSTLLRVGLYSVSSRQDIVSMNIS
jgi:hypothetical protein